MKSVINHGMAKMADEDTRSLTSVIKATDMIAEPVRSLIVIDASIGMTAVLRLNLHVSGAGPKLLRFKDRTY